MNQNERKTVLHRMLLLIAVACVIMGLYAMRLIFLQLVNGDDFKAKATNTTDYNFTVTAARGDIVDSAGRRIATTATSYNVVLNKLLMGDRDLDAMLQQIVELLRENGESWNDTLLIGQPDAAGRYAFTDDDSSASDQKQLADMKETLALQQYATANDVMEMLVEKNELQGFSLEWQRVLAGIHYEMDRQAWQKTSVRQRWPPSRSTAFSCPAWRSWRPVPAATIRAISSRPCWAVWARSPLKSGR